MSIDYNTYVGPYIEVYNPEKDSTEEYHSCPNKKCTNHTKDISAGFCSECGSKIERMSRKCKERVDFDTWEEFDDSICEVLCGYKPDGCENFMYLVSNVGKIGLNLDGRNPSINEIDCGKPLVEIFDFKSIKKKEIDRLKEVFGTDNVKIKWGVLVWCS